MTEDIVKILLPINATKEQERFTRQYARLIAEITCQKLYRYWIPRIEFQNYHGLKEKFEAYLTAESELGKALKGKNKKAISDAEKAASNALEQCIIYYAKVFGDE